MRCGSPVLRRARSVHSGRPSSNNGLGDTYKLRIDLITLQSARGSVQFLRTVWRNPGSRRLSRCSCVPARISSSIPHRTRRLPLQHKPHRRLHSTCLVSFAVLVYFLLTIMPLHYHNSPYQTPLSSFVWSIIKAALLIKLWLSR